MCGRYYIDADEYEIQQIIREVEKRQGVTVKTGEIYPTDSAPVIHRSENGRELAAVKWGFPKWQASGVIINARAESALDKKMFRSSVLERRCVIPCSGFFEWSHAGNKKQKDKYFLSRPTSKTTYLAGVWNTFHSAGGDYPAYVILTTQANDSMIDTDRQMDLFQDEQKPIHDRMPVILDPNECDKWLFDDEFTESVLQRHGVKLAMVKVAT